MQQFHVFWKLSENLLGNVCDRGNFSQTLVLQSGLKYGIVFIISDSSKICQTVITFSYTPFYGFFQTLNRNALLWMTALFGAKLPEWSKICQTVAVFSY